MPFSKYLFVRGNCFKLCKRKVELLRIFKKKGLFNQFLRDGYIVKPDT